jgi:hypothetical protein
MAALLRSCRSSACLEDDAPLGWSATALGTKKVSARAIGIMIERYRMSEDEAFAPSRQRIGLPPVTAMRAPDT